MSGRNGVVTWPEGYPGQARWTPSRVVAFWWMYGPPALKQTLLMRRMCRVLPIPESMSPVVAARNCERMLHARRFG